MDFRRLSCAALVAGAAALAGCMTTGKPEPAEAPKPVAARAAAPSPDDPIGVKARLRAFITHDGLTTTPAKPGEAARLTAAWNNKIIYAPDPVHGGQPVPGLMGKLWLFGPDVAVPLTVDGEIFVGVWDNGPTVNGGPPVLLEAWHIDAEAAKKLRRPDFIGGDAYNLFLPMSQYNVDLKRINVVARFNGADGRSLVSAPETLTLDHSATLQRAAERLGGLGSGPARPEAAGPIPNPLPINFPEAPRK
jgi:hypothetical protein